MKIKRSLIITNQIQKVNNLNEMFKLFQFYSIPNLIYRSLLHLQQMNHQTNSSHLQSPPLYNFQFADQLNVSQDRKDSRSSSIKSQQFKDSLNKSKVDQVLQEIKNQQKNAEESLLEGIDQNEFIPRCAQNEKNAIFRTEAQFLNQNQEYALGTVQQQQNQPDHETSFLLDSATYKEICIEEHSKKVEFQSNFELKSLAQIQDVCSIHEKPFEIVCIEDKTLVCSHCAIFGQHKTHSLAPLNQIEKYILAKKTQISQIISDYKGLQLNIKQKSFGSQFIEKIGLRKKEVKLTVEEQMRKIRQFLLNYEKQINTELDQLYEGLESKITDCIKRTCLDQNTEAFERWQKDAWAIVQQVTCQQVSMKNRVNLFLNNFTMPQVTLSSKAQQNLEPVSLQIEGEKYYQEIKEQLNWSITQVMKTLDVFNVSLSQSFKQNIKSLFTFQCDSKIIELLDERKLSLIDERIAIMNSFDSVKESMKHLHKANPNTSIPKLPEHQLASTVVSISQSTPLHLNPISQNSTKFNSPSKNNDHFKQTNPKPEPRTQTIKKSLKYKRYQTLQDMKKLQQNIRTAKSPTNIIDAKSQCGQKKRRISPCLKQMAGSDNEKLFIPSSKPRIQRCTSKDFPSHKRSTSDQITKDPKNVQFKQKHSKQISEKDQDPLKTLQNYEKSDTQTLDLSEANLNDAEILYFVQKASKIRKIKHLKLSSNLLTSQGFEKLIPYLSSCNLINLSNNRLSQLAVELILRKKEKLGQLKMLNLANNKLNERKIKEKIQLFKKMNIVVTL